MEDVYLIVWVLVFLLLNERNVVVVNQFFFYIMKCIDIEVQENNVSLMMFMFILWNDFVVCNYNINKSSSLKELQEGKGINVVIVKG